MSVSKKRIWHIVLISAGIVLAASIFYGLARLGIGIPCLFHFITGLQCPGCGNSRVALCLLHLDIAGALSYNLLFPLQFGYLAWIYLFACKNYLQGKSFSYKPRFPVIDILILCIFLAWGIIRNL